jgi:hypothetical protein
VFSDVRAAAAEVCRRARFVRIDHDRLADHARSLPIDAIARPVLDSRHHFLGTQKETVAFFLTLDSINFGSGYFPHLRKRPGLSGYFTVATCLTEHFRTHGPIGAGHLASLTSARCREMFHQSPDEGPVDELMTLFARALNDLGKLVTEDFDGDFERLVESVDRSASKLVATLSRMPFFRDVQRYATDLEVPFYKRAQLTAADLNLALDGRELGAFDDLDRLTIFADNLVPHVLRVDGVLQYDSELARRIDAGELVAAGSLEEIEIRAGAIHASEHIVQALRSNGRAVNAMQIDYLLWNRGQQRSYKARPRHRSRTVFY